jgi:elongator complex protein 3
MAVSFLFNSLSKLLDLKNKGVSNLDRELKRNETAMIRCIGLTIETKPDWAKEEHCREMLRYGCTRLEIGVQTLTDEVLKIVNRGHSIKDTIEAFQVSKDMCFKINAHMMIGLPGSSFKQDEENLKDLFRLKEFRPDMLKIYPCLVIRGTPLYNYYQKGHFKPISTDEAAKIIARAFASFPRYVRVMRVQRDIPTTIVEEGGIDKSNLRQLVDEEMIKMNVESKDIRSREIGFRELAGYKIGKLEINIEEYEASSGKEFFIDVIDENDTLLGFIRLRFPSKDGYMKEINMKTALIRELHIYGQTVPVGETGDSVQHRGWGKKLVEVAEFIAMDNGYEKMAIISGIGVREYYKKLGYKLEGPYMCKKL